MTTIMFHIPGTPVAKGRPIVSTFGGKPRMRTPDRTLRYESQVAAFAAHAMAGRAPIDAAVIVEMTATFPVAASWPKKRQAAALLGEIRPIGKPDADNIAKSVGDGCNGIVWTDDSRIAELTVRKRYGATPGLHVVVTWAGGESAQASLLEAA